MPHLLMPDVFWTDVALGIAAFACGRALYQRSQSASAAFVAAALSAWFAAVSHGFFETAATPISKTIWVLALAGIAVSSLALVQFSLRQPTPAPWLLAALVAYLAFAVFVSDDIIWVAIIQAAAATTFGVSLLRYSLAQPKRLPRQAPISFASYVACTALGAVIAVPGAAMGLPLSPLAVFHIIEIPAVILLYTSVRSSLSYA